eukprot:Gregarina_sp_Poly_1__10315@NODE_729_length_6566_cov_116_680412_g546_i0_p2_GENE_NODE_729_length_6566_cov_116_680412_g546_i0NODE_729_length_6566_cov_116_680412_g546_i0_p2_ORF_typecomplete_len525_score69_95_NODE_729_length_6566_cov_116_680412_g546_i044936067
MSRLKHLICARTPMLTASKVNNPIDQDPPFVSSFSRTSTCCTLSALSSSNDSVSESDEEDPMDCALIGAQNQFIRRNSSPSENFSCLVSSVPNQAVSTPLASKTTYIMYLLPSLTCKRGHTLTVARRYLGTLLGFDESHLYPLHCTLTSFFTVEADVPKSHINAILADAFISHILERFNVTLTPTTQTRGHVLARTRRGVPKRWRKRRSGRLPPINAAEDVVAGDEISESDDEEQDDNDDSLDGDVISAGDIISEGRLGNASTAASSDLFNCEEPKTQRNPENGEGTAIGAEVLSTNPALTTMAEKREKTPVNELQTILSQPSQYSVEDSVAWEFTCSSRLLEVTHVPSVSRQESDQRQFNSQLQNVFVTKDGSVILPISLNWKSQQSPDESGAAATRNHLKELCHRMETSMRTLLPHCTISTSRHKGCGIQPKAASHLALSSHKNKPQVWPPATIAAAAKMLDSAATPEARDYWDIALCELQSWGSVDDVKSSSFQNSLTPHMFRDVARISRVGVTMPWSQEA